MLALLIRHAQALAQDRIGLRAGLALSEQGEQQAAALARRLQRVEIAAIFSSPLRRTMQTAEIIAAAHDLRITPEQALIEVNPGDWENRPVKELAGDPEWSRYNSFRSGTRIPGGEMMIEVQARVVTFLERAARDFPGRAVAIVSHADVIRAALCHYIGIPLDLSLRIEIGPASVSVLEVEPWGARLRELNHGGDLDL
ncbi:MAG TPA: histidine phosphatase family protein [Bryobacteraceae bacterium]|jgi:broad specificity phosphatase PhoE|nr:histidine phosphatase family protein [Bryobacteraceae bacterium]